LLSPNGITTILFDFDGTLRHSQPLASDFFTDFVIRCGYPISEDDRRRSARWEHYYWATSQELAIDLKLIDGDDEQAFWRNYAYRRLISLGFASAVAESFAPEVSMYMGESYQRKDVIPEELFGVLGILKGAGYKLGVVSNRDKPFWEELVKLDLCPYFEFSLAAGEVQSWKPDAGIFQAALERIDSSAAQTLYVGDNYFADVVGAHRAGLQPVLYDLKGIFHEPGCPVIASFDELLRVVKSLTPPQPSP